MEIGYNTRRAGDFLARVLTGPNPRKKFNMDKKVSIVLSVERHNYRKLAQEWYGLSDEQMAGMDVHHNPARHEGGRNIPEHLYVYHSTLHAAVHDGEFVLWAREGGKKGAEKTHEWKNEEGKSIVAVTMNQKTHAEKNEQGKSIHGIKSSQRLNKEKNEEGKSVNAIKGAKKVHEERDEFGRSVFTLKHTEKMNERLHSEKDQNGNSKHAVKNGKKVLTALREKDPDHQSKAGRRGAEEMHKQVWESTIDGFRSGPGPVANHNKANGWNPSARVRIK